ncbi:MAG: 2-amino-4-hydroxy-6-hydroxymethyldihydropteridine diphosphokinase [Rickettsiales bacterium]|nr:2-amino-4-hydroxy-6-hydroxymethyldihydropteridine diphosphokinase [Rickettsiales bacterium]
MKKIIAFNLGSNIGKREKYLELATSILINDLGLMKIEKSHIFESKAMLLEDSPQEWNKKFYNISIAAKICLEKFPPEKILSKIKIIEKEVGRIDRGKWAPREIDIDILLIEGVNINEKDGPIIPHYDLENREFFVKTLEEVLPNWKDFV